MAKIFLFRHAQSEDNKNGVFSGKRDPILTKEGMDEAKILGEKLKGEPATKAYCGTNLRTKHTLEIVLENHSEVEMIADPRINERDYGELTGKSKEEIDKNDPKNYTLWHRSYDVPPPGGESLKDVEQRVKPFIDELILNVRQNDLILICASGNSLRPIRKHFEHMTNDEMRSFEHTPGKIYEYEV